MLFPQHDELSRTYVRLKGQHFPLSLPLKVLDHLVSVCVTYSSLRQPVYDQLPTDLWLYDLVWRGALLLHILDLKVLIRGVVLT